MKKNSDTRFNFYEKSITITSFLVPLILLLGSAVFMIFGYVNLVYLYVGAGFFAAMLIITLIVFFCMPVFVKINENEISITNLFGQVKSKQNLEELKSINILYLMNKNAFGGDFLCLVFSSREITQNMLSDVYGEDDIILFAYTKEREEIIKKYTSVPITDKRKQ